MGNDDPEWISLDGLAYVVHKRGQERAKLAEGWYSFEKGFRSALAKRVEQLCIMSGTQSSSLGQFACASMLTAERLQA